MKVRPVIQLITFSVLLRLRLCRNENTHLKVLGAKLNFRQEMPYLLIKFNHK